MNNPFPDRPSSAPGIRFGGAYPGRFGQAISLDKIHGQRDNGPMPRVTNALFFCAGMLFLTVLSSAAERPNFIFFLADDLGFNDVGFNNPDSFYETPHLDQLADSGTVFTDFYAACQVCSPTRASIMTGKYPARLKTTNFFSGKRPGTFEPAFFEEHLALEETTVAEALREGGYQTYFAGKWHLGPKGYEPELQGFDINRGGGVNGAPRSYFAPYKNIESLKDGPEGEYLTNRLALESETFLRQAAKSGKPFLLYHSFYGVHTPLQAPEALVEKYRKKAEKLGLTSDDGRFESGHEAQVWPESKDPRVVRIRQDHAVYAAMVESLDIAVGRILKTLEESGAAGDTVVVFMSDNGGLSTSEGLPTSNIPLRGGKGWIYDGGIREPMVVRWPGVTRPGTRCNVPLISTDFYPTMLEMAGLAARPDQHVDGMSFVPLLRNPFAKFERGPIFWHYPHYSNQGGFPASAVRLGNHKLIQNLEDGSIELYNLEEDLREHNNLEQLEADSVKELLGTLNAWRRQIGAESLQKNKKTGATPPVLW